MSLQRLLRSIARDLLPHARLEFHTRGGLHLLVPDRGAWSSASETYFQRIYEPFFPHLKDVRHWVDLGCNHGFFSFWLLDQLTAEGRPPPATRALLGDANAICVERVRQAIARNRLQPGWQAEQIIIGPPDSVVEFKRHKDSLGSNIFGQGRGVGRSRHQVTNLAARLAGERELFDLVKIDIEGAEKYLFGSQVDLLARFRFGLCEWHAPAFSGSDLSRCLASRGWGTLELRSQGVEYDLSRGHAWESPMGMVLWENPNATG